ncbi:MAG: hypothetical protein K5751_07820 [Treponemataceae bacterium]|nr:hypothetical protein [Treponemataceae bacterium]
MKTMKEYNGRITILENGDLADGTYFVEDWILRYKDGLLNNEQGENGEVLPAVEKNDGTHYEFFVNGKLHREDAPAIIDLLDDIEEWWLNGNQVRSPSGRN